MHTDSVGMRKNKEVVLICVLLSCYHKIYDPHVHIYWLTHVLLQSRNNTNIMLLFLYFS